MTRNNIGNINSGLAFFDTSWGYNPFFNPGSLTWFKSPGVSGVNNGLSLSSATRVEAGVVASYTITSTGHLFRLQGEGSSGSDLRTLTDNGETYTYGADIMFFGLNTLMVSHDKGVTKVIIDASGNYVSNAPLGAWDATHFTQITTRRSMALFLGKLYITNSDPSVTYANNIAEVDSTLTINYARLTPSLPSGSFIRDIDVSSDLTYLLISSSYIPSELLAPVNDGANAGAGGSTLSQWNGIDAGVTTGNSLPSFGITALEGSNGKDTMFMYDPFGAALYEGGTKKLTLRNQKSPMAGATATAGNFVTWVSPDFYWNDDTQAGAIYGSLYYYGRLDADSPLGLWRMFRISSAIGGVIYSMPYNKFSANRYVSVNSGATIQVDTNGTHLFSYIDYSGSGGSTVNNNSYFYISPPDDSPGGWSGAVLGVYQTQVQMFSKRQTVKQVRVYCNPTTTSNGFNLDLIGPDNKKISNGSFSYTYAAGSDLTTLKGPLSRIEFNPATLNTYGVGLRITNTGSANMTIDKIEVDIAPSGN